LRGTTQPLMTYSAVLDRAQHEEFIRARLDPLLTYRDRTP